MISEEDFVPLNEVFQPIFFSLINVLLAKARYPSDQDLASWSLGKCVAKLVKNLIELIL